MQMSNQPEPWEHCGPLPRDHLCANASVRYMKRNFPTRGCSNFSSSLMTFKDSRYMLQLGRDMTAFPQGDKQ